MGISLGLNIASLQAQRKLNVASQQLNKTYERLSSGQRINTASDDAAGLQIADTLRAQARIASVALRNANDGISTVSIADSALSEIGNVLTRLAELAQQSANGTYSVVQRSALSGEFVALSSEIERIAVTTEFNGVKLISATTVNSYQVGFNGTANAYFTVTGVVGSLQGLGLANAGSSSLTFSLTGINADLGVTASRIALDAVNGAIQSLSTSRGTLGAAQSRLEYAINAISSARENFSAAESRIRDADVAADAAELTRLTILQQAGASILAQANQRPALALQLLS